jgi:uroporphyrinogen-III synthase
VGGRDLLRETLLARGARVDYAECYRRTRLAVDMTALVHAWTAGDVDAVVVTSTEGLRNLWDMLDANGRSLLAKTPIFVPHPRIAEAARKLGLPGVMVTGAGDDATMRSLFAYFPADSRRGPHVAKER